MPASASGAAGELTCARDNAGRFQEHFARRWGGAPFPAAHFYYDAVVLLAMGLQDGLTHEGRSRRTIGLQKRIRDLNAATNQAAHWDQLGDAMAALASGSAVRYVGAAAEYTFDQYGAAQHTILDAWTIDRRQLRRRGSFKPTAVFQLMRRSQRASVREGNKHGKERAS